MRVGLACKATTVAEDSRFLVRLWMEIVALTLLARCWVCHRRLLSVPPCEREISDYLLARVNTPWMQEVMGTLQEVNLDDVRQILREPADAKWGDTAVAVATRDTQPTAVAVAVEVADQDTAEAVVLRRNAIKWVTKSKDLIFIANLVDTLPGAVADEQVRLYQASKRAAIVPHAPQAIVVYPHFVKSRQEAAHMFDAELRNEGWAPGTRLPRTSAIKLAGKLVWSRCTSLPELGHKARALRRWHQF